MAHLGSGKYMGFNREPPPAHGPKESGGALVHSHSMKPKLKLRGQKKMVPTMKRHGRKR